MQSIGSGRPAPFHATLINARPTGEIETQGQFGPWNREEPRSTFLSATYTFKNARLADFDGIAGTLSSRGKFGGILERIEADGETDTPDFTVRLSGNPISLHTKYHAIIDGTNGK